MSRSCQYVDSCRFVQCTETSDNESRLRAARWLYGATSLLAADSVWRRHRRSSIGQSVVVQSRRRPGIMCVQSISRPEVKVEEGPGRGDWKVEKEERKSRRRREICSNRFVFERSQ